MLLWLQLLFIAEDYGSRIVRYVLTKMEENPSSPATATSPPSPSSAPTELLLAWFCINMGVTL
jgi:hypothetical protein